MNLIAPDKAAKMAAIQNNLLPGLGIVSHEDTKTRRHEAAKAQGGTPISQASNIKHPSIQHPVSSILKQVLPSSLPLASVASGW
jgi:hypothetical protein